MDKFEELLSIFEEAVRNHEYSTSYEGNTFGCDKTPEQATAELDTARANLLAFVKSSYKPF